MERLILVLVALVCALAPSMASGWLWLSTLAPLVVGAVGLFFNSRSDRRGDREEARALRAERRAEDAERRAAEAEQRAEEAHAWERERREAEQARSGVRARIEQWVAEKRQAHGTSYFQVAASELDLARGAAAAGLVDLRELPGSDGSVLDAMARVSGSMILPGD